MRGGVAPFELKVSWERQAKTPTATILARGGGEADRPNRADGV